MLYFTNTVSAEKVAVPLTSDEFANELVEFEVTVRDITAEYNEISFGMQLLVELAKAGVLTTNPTGNR